MRLLGGRRGSLSTRLAFAFLLVLLLALLAWLLLKSGRLTGDQADGAGEVRAVLPAPALLPDAGAPERAPLAGLPAAEAPAVEATAAPLPETRIFGALLDPALEPIRGVWYAGVSITDQAGVRSYADTDQAGGYSFSSLAFGSYWLTAGAEGFRGQSAAIELSPDAPVVRKDFILRDSVMLRIRLVTPEGGDVFDALREMKAPSGASVIVPVATTESPGPRFNEVFGSLNNPFGVGHFWNYGPRVDKLPPGYMGILVLDGDLPVWVSLVHYHNVLESQRVEPGQEEIVFVVSPDALIAGLATVQVQVLDAESGLPVPGAKVSLQGHGGYERDVSSDAEGTAILKDRMPGLFELNVRADGFEKFRLPVDALPGVVTDLGVVELEKEVTIQGFVLDGDGQPLALEFTMGLVDAADGSIRWLRNDTFKSKDDGSFQMRGLGRHEYVIRSSNQAALNPDNSPGIVWVSGIVRCDTRSGSLSAFDIRLRPASSLVLQVADGRGDGMRFRVLEESGRELLASRFYGSGPRPMSLPTGEYRVLLLDSSGQVLSERSLTLGSGTVYLELTP